VKIKAPKKLIEVALPLDDINAAAAREKSIRHGHPSTLHLWWARRPLAAARAVIFAQMVNDPGYERSLGRGVNKEKAQLERERLFNIIRELVKWENTNNESVLQAAREEIWKSWRETCALNKNHPQAAELFNPDKLPAFHDPFAGGGALPLEAQRLGLESYASDLNPVAVLINKAMIEIPPRFAGRKPVGPIPAGEKQGKLHEDWSGAKGLAEDVRRYGIWMRDKAIKRIGHLYPMVKTGKGSGGGETPVIAWIWARTVKSPNPVYAHVDVPLISSFVLSSKKGKEAWVEPVVEGDGYRFAIRNGAPPMWAKSGTKLSRGANFKCLVSDTPIDPKHIYAEANAGRMGARLMAVVAEGARGRIYLPPSDEIESLAKKAHPEWSPEVPMPENPRWFSPPLYGLKTYGDLFTSRQLVGLTTFSDLVREVRDRVLSDVEASTDGDAGIDGDERGLETGGSGKAAYADAVATMLGLAVDKAADYNSTICGWISGGETLRNTFGRQAIPMVWDFCEANIVGRATGSFLSVVSQMAKAIAMAPALAGGRIDQQDARMADIRNRVVSTDPPYYDNIGYADLSDFFYVWLRRALRPIYPSLFATIAVPKAEELVATPYRHGSREAAEKFFLDGMRTAMHQLAERTNPSFPTTIYYAFKQSDTSDAGTGNTGWETFLEAVLQAGFMIVGTWPMRTEREARSIGIGTNALASSIVLVCRRREAGVSAISRRDFLRELKEELSEAVDVMIGGAEGISPIAPVDLAQAVIGPGMAIFSKYAAVLEADGSPMSVHSALLLINRLLIEGGDDFDADTQFCLGWFDEQGWAFGEFGKADVLARAKGTAVDGVRDSGAIESKAGKVRLIKWGEYPTDWSPEHDSRTPTWEALHQLIRALQKEDEEAAGALLARMPERSEPIRSLAYRLYTLCERKGWAEDARAYNELVTAWHAIEARSHEAGRRGEQTIMDF